MVGKIKEEKDAQPHVVECGDCNGEKPQPDNSYCATCIARKKLEAKKAEQELLVPMGCKDCPGNICIMQAVQGLCDGTHCPQKIGIPCCMNCPVNTVKTAM